MTYQPRSSAFPALIITTILVVASGGAFWWISREVEAAKERARAAPAQPVKEPAKPEPKEGPRPKPRPVQTRPVEVAPFPSFAVEKPLTFEDALKLVEAEGKKIAEDFEKERETKERLLLPDELQMYRDAIAQKVEGSSGIRFADFMRKHRMAKWVWAAAIRRSVADPSFESIAKIVWERSPKMRNPDELLELAAKWGEMDLIEQKSMRQLIDMIEKRTRTLSAQARDLVVDFAGEEYYANRP